LLATIIAFVLKNLPAFLLVAALVIASIPRDHDPWAARFLSWILLLPIGVTGLWAALFHLAFPARAAALIGWETSPFQFEVGMADLAIGVTACIAFWRPLPFKAAAVCVASIFLLGDAVGHVHQMVSTGDFAAGNAGTPFFMDIIGPVLSIALLIAAQREQKATMAARQRLKMRI
jgi:DMSO reductase anchor subunit